MKLPDITIIGAGNVGYHLAKQLHESGFPIQQIFSRKAEHAQRVAELTGAAPIHELSAIDSSAAIYILAVPDDQIEIIASVLSLPNDKIIVHTSGTVSSSILKNITDNYGCFYPLQTFSREKDIDFSEIPVCIQGSNPGVTDQLKKIATAISKKVVVMSDEDRLYLHISAVFINNFTNYIIGAGKEIAQQNNIDFEILKPLLKETISKAIEDDPHKIQTGPARRGDRKTIEKHLKLLEKDPDHQSVYKLLSEIIAGKYKK